MRSSLLVLGLSSLAAADSIHGKVRKEDDLDAVVYLAEVGQKKFPPPEKPLEMEQRGQAFRPHVLPVLLGTTVRFPNNDRVRHNVFSPAGAQPFNFGIYPPGAVKELTFNQLGVVMLLCNIHENMSAFVLVLQNPYFALVGADGRYTLAAVPPGSYTLTLWTEGRPFVTRRVAVHGDTEVDFK